MTYILTGEKHSASGVRCSFSTNAIDLVKKYNFGDPFEIKGKCTGKLLEVVLILYHTRPTGMHEAVLKVFSEVVAFSQFFRL